MNISYIAHISGKVQGVYFRAYSQQVAIDNSVSGYARNLADGDLEVLMSGEKHNVEKMLAWLKNGPPLAEVEKVNEKQVQWQEFDFFSIS